MPEGSAAVRRIPIRKYQGEFVQSKTNMLRIRPGFYKAVGACRETPQSGPLGLPAPLSGALLGERIQPPLKGEEGRA